jgi:UDP-2-acetamido-3-amino-2,3-dideoxy-glucuronate N-acetyltransferase
MHKRICVVGAGRWGKNHVRTLAALGCLGGVVEPDRATRAALGEQYAGIPLFPNLEEALAAPCDGYTVATPAETHVAVAEAILSARRPVLVEKPPALTAADARRLTALARRNGVNLMVGHVMLFHPAIQKIRELLRSGKIGKLEYLYSNRLNLGTVRTEENILWSFAPHDISIFQFLIGARPVEVVSRGGAFVQPHIHDTTMTILRYPQNTVAHAFVSWLHPFKEHRLVVIGSRGMLSYDDASESKDLLFYEKGVDWIRGAPVKHDGPTEIVPYQREQPLTAELRYFVEHLHGPLEIADGESGVEVLEILEEATRSLLPENERRGQAEPVSSFFVHPSSFVDAGAEIGEGTKIWHFSHIQSNARIGRHCSIGQNVNIANEVRIGDHVKIQNNVSIYEGVELEDYVFCGPAMVFTNVRNPRCKYPQRGAQHYVRTLVKAGASIGANATIVCGHTIGRHAFIAAGAVVTGDVADYALMMGVPARRVGWMCECGTRLPDRGERRVCPKCARPYGCRDDLLVALAEPQTQPAS